VNFVSSMTESGGIRITLLTAVRFFLARHDARLALPEVVRLEVILHLAKRMKELAADSRRAHRALLPLAGSLRELILPEDAELDAIAARAFDDIRVPVFEVPFSLESARAAFEKCVRGEAPSGPKDQQFKDGVVWADCLRLAHETPVLFITQDKGFYEGRDYGKGLAGSLKREAGQALHDISISHELSAVLERVRETVPVNYDEIESAVLTAEKRTELSRMVGAVGYTLGDRVDTSHQLFATDNPAEALIEFALTFRGVNPDGREGMLTLRGEGRYLSDSGAIVDPRPRGDEFIYTDEDGEKKRANHVFGAGAAHLGHRVVQHDVRAPL
jgi:hypothetical protein